MALPILEKDISHISKLADEPNDVSGGELSAADLKAEFDRAGNDIKTFLNDTLIPYLQGVEAAASIGIRTISGLSEAADIQAALEALKLAIDNTSVGGIPDSSLSGAKFVPQAITNRELGLGAVEGKNVADKTLTGDKLADKTLGGEPMKDEFLEHRHLGKLIVENENIADGTIDASGKIKDGTITAKKHAPRSIPQTALQLGAVGTDELADGGVTISKFANDALYSPMQATGNVTNYSFVESDLGKTVAPSSDAASSDIVFTMTDAVSKALPYGGEIAVLFRYGKSLKIVFETGASSAIVGDTAFVADRTYSITERFGMVALKKIDYASSGSTQYWLVTGNVEVVS